ncbi:exodeoxyribonuclease III [Ornithinibacillus salinisoli]|uniref:Exodeoxyribonuclease III n=1 Tax=Ornithinibacillus salinisoli TaxID=1848459 RepID=A0ABW4VX91_9BACI
MKLVSWNVNGLRACVRKGFLDYFHKIDADIFCVQETKLQEGQIQLDVEGYYQYWNYAERKGYSGTAVFTKKKPLSVNYGLGNDSSQVEGRIITLEFDSFYLVNVYTPNSQRDLARLDIRLEWEDRFLEHIKTLDAMKPVVLCGDLNVAHHEIDLKNYKTNHGNSGFTKEERGKMTRLLNTGFVDTLRHFHPETEGLYTWWSYMKTVRERNIGWRIDYFIVSNRLENYLIDSQAHTEIYGSDHCPIILEMEAPKNH